MKRDPAQLIAALRDAYRPDAPVTVELVPGDHEAIAKLEQQQAWGAMVRRWFEGDIVARRSFNAFRADEMRVNRGRA